MYGNFPITRAPLHTDNNFKVGDRVYVNARTWYGEVGVILKRSVGHNPNYWDVEVAGAWVSISFDELALTAESEYSEAVKVLGEGYFA